MNLNAIKKTTKTSMKKTSPTTVSIIIPAYNEEVLLPFTLNSLKNQDYKSKFEIIVCDNNSSDKTAQIARKFGAKVVKELRKGSSFAYDTGMRAATGDIILVTNADTLLPKDWISSIVKEYEEDPEVVAIGTYVKFYNAPSWVNLVLQILDFINPVKAMWGTSMSCRRWAFYEVDGFQHGVNTNEDALFTLKLKKVGKFKRINNVIVLMDGRRFNGGFINALKAWNNGIGLNALQILFNLIFTREAKGSIKDFEDIRED